MVGVTPTNLWPYTLDFPACLAPIPNRHFYFKLKLGLGTPLPKFARLSPGFAVLSFTLAAEPNPSTAKILDACWPPWTFPAAPLFSELTIH